MKLARLPDGEPEIFHTIQGEGRSAGTPSVFVRASLCNLYCRWCDTDYTWNWEGTEYTHDRDGEPGFAKYRKEEQIIDVAPAEVAERVAACGCGNVVLTGGEPLIQQRDFLEVIRDLKRHKAASSFEVETNGTIVPLPEFISAVTRFNVSPKLSNSAVRIDDRLKPEVLETFARLDAADFKFVVDSKADVDEIREMTKRFAIPPQRIFLMPQGISAVTISEKAEWLIEICKRHGFRFSDRLHVRLWGDRRGV